ncbi:MAG: hypothetical protein JHD35_13920 [Sphingopyxis sp.]|nr:hypothetical protein [Sphingopyxis sp.]
MANEIALLRRIAAARDDQSIGKASAFGWARLERAMDAVDEGTKSDKRRIHWHFGQMAAAALLAVIAWQAAVIPNMTSQQEAEADYQTAGEAAAEGHSIRVAFHPEASEGAIRSALLDADATIIDGPSALGLYRLGFADKGHQRDGVAKLRARDEIVESITEE